MISVSNIRVLYLINRLLSRHDMNMSQALQSDEEFKDVLEKISTNASLKEKMLARKTIVQVKYYVNYKGEKI